MNLTKSQIVLRVIRGAVLLSSIFSMTTMYLRAALRVLRCAALCLSLTVSLLLSVQRAALAFARGGSIVVVLFLLFCHVTDSSAQWRNIAPKVFPESIYFLDLPGPPRIGFVSGSFRILRTSDGGQTWDAARVTNPNYGEASDFVFKDSLTGWASNSNDGIYKTTDGGLTWTVLSLRTSTEAVHYDSVTGFLLAAQFALSTSYTSTDEGLSWTESRVGFSNTGFEFDKHLRGVLSSSGRSPWSRTLDGGATWSTLKVDSECWQPLAIAGTSTYFALTDISAAVLRTDDCWDSWREVSRFSPADILHSPGVTGCVRGDLSHLFVLVGSGCYISTDQGVTWKFLCGPPDFSIADRRFYVKYPYVYATTYNDVWMLNLDSLYSSGYAPELKFDDGSKQNSLSPGNAAEVYISQTSSDSSIGSDSAHFAVRYDTKSLSVKAVTAMNSWQIVNEIDMPGSIEVWLRGSGNLSTLPILSTTFSTVLADTVAKVYLEEPIIYSHRKNCDCAFKSNPGSDSVEINFAGCGGPTLWHFMQTGQIFDLLSVSPNPANDELRVDIKAPRSDDRVQGVSMEVIDLLGRSWLSRTTDQPTSQIDISRLPAGTYFLRLSKDGEVRTRRFLVTH